MRDDERFTESLDVDAGYLDVFPDGDCAAVRTVEVSPSVMVDVRTDTDEVIGIELLTLDSPLARWLKAASDALRRDRGTDVPDSTG